jgi:hypothetical protein
MSCGTSVGCRYLRTNLGGRLIPHVQETSGHCQSASSICTGVLAACPDEASRGSASCHRMCAPSRGAAAAAIVACCPTLLNLWSLESGECARRCPSGHPRQKEFLTNASVSVTSAPDAKHAARDSRSVPGTLELSSSPSLSSTRCAPTPLYAVEALQLCQAAASPCWTRQPPLPAHPQHIHIGGLAGGDYVHTPKWSP